jgi:hypothetical protein
MIIVSRCSCCGRPIEGALVGSFGSVGVFDRATRDQKSERGGLKADRYCVSFTFQLWELVPVGCGLPAMQTPRCIWSTQSMPSQASQLPQGDAQASSIRSATRLPRFVFDLRRPPKSCIHGLTHGLPKLNVIR